MSLHQVAWNATTKVALIQADAAAIPGGSVDIGTYEHSAPTTDIFGDDKSHVHYHHVQELLYKHGHEDMSVVKIQAQNTSVDLLPAALGLKVGQTMRLKHQVLPAMSDQAVVWASSDATKATVSSTGLVTAVAAGTTNITATKGAQSDTCAVTVIA